MNIFIMIFAVLIMGVYFMMASPAQRIQQQETEYAITQADMRSVAECTSAAHNAALKGDIFDDRCIEQNGIISKNICLGANLKETKCEIVRNRKPEYSYIITTTAPLDDTDFDSMMQILEANYSDAGTFGIFQNQQIMAGGTATRRAVPAAVIKALNMTDGMLVYMTQYEMPDTDTEFSAPYAPNVVCPAGTVKTYRFNRWQCVGYNTKTACGGDMIWDSDLMECVADETRKPLCASEQTAVIIDEVWECINPFPEKKCPDNMVARLNYTTLEWECVADPTTNRKSKKCTNFTSNVSTGAVGATARISAISCTDCEKMVIDEETCTSACVPDTTRLGDKNCYGVVANECSGGTRGFYFGFPNMSYTSNIAELHGRTIPTGRAYLRNRMFNCMDCGPAGVNTDLSYPPYITICNGDAE